VAVAAFHDADSGRLILVGEKVLQVFDVTGDAVRRLGTKDFPSAVRSAVHDSKTGRLFTGHDDGIRAWDVAGRKVGE